MIFLVRKPVTLSLDTEIVAAVDARAGWDSRSRTVERMLLRVLGPNLDADLGRVVSSRGRGRPRKVSSDLSERVMSPSPGALRRELEAQEGDSLSGASEGVREPESGSVGVGQAFGLQTKAPELEEPTEAGVSSQSPLAVGEGSQAPAEPLRKESAVDRNIRLAEARQALLKAQRDS